MSKGKKKNLLSLLTLEYIIILVFFASFLVWSMSKCNATRKEYQAKAIQEDSLALVDKQALNDRGEAAKAAAQRLKDSIQQKQTSKIVTVKEPYTPLYISIDGLNMRTGPYLDSMVVSKLTLNEEVIFLQEVTDFKQRINLGEKEAFEPWIKVKTQEGKTGWVYGAGVHYYKYKTPSVKNNIE